MLNKTISKYIKSAAMCSAALSMTAVLIMPALGNSTYAAKKFSVSKSSITLYVKKSVNIKYTAPSAVTVKLSDPKAVKAEVKKNVITIKGVKSGNAVLKVKCGNNTKKLKVEVRNRVTNTVGNCVNTSDKINRFSCEMFNALRNNKENTYVSPLSVYTAYAMVSNGAGGNTKGQILKTLGINSLEEFNSQIGSYVRHDKISKSDSSEPGGVTYSVDNSLWINGNSVLSANIDNAFIAPLKQYYNAEVFKNMNFDDPGTKDTINGWAAKKTNNNIKNIVDDIDSEDTALLLNTVYFKGQWLSPFNAGNTKKETFSSVNGKKKVNMMSQKNCNFKYYKDGKFEGLELMYGDSYVMDILMSSDKNKTVGEVWEKLSVKKQEAVIKKFDKKGFSDIALLKLPGIDMEYKTDMIDVLRKMGIKDAFNAKADFSNIGDVYIRESIHKTRLVINENGTESSASTSVVMSKGDNKGKIKFIVDRPFICCIRNTSTGAIIFMGEINNL